MPTRRWFAGAATVDGILRYGGEGPNGCGGVIPTVEAYDPLTDTWTTKAPMPTARYTLGVGVVDGIIYAIGGANGTAASTYVEAYDPVTNSWTTKTSMPTARNALVIGVVNGKIYAIGGNADDDRYRHRYSVGVRSGG